jgi:hypothetical protein
LHSSQDTIQWSIVQALYFNKVVAWRNTAMAQDGRLLLRILSASGRSVTGPISIFLKNLNRTHNPERQIPTSPATITGLHRRPNGNYQIQVSAAGYHMVGQIIEIPASGQLELDVRLPIKAQSVSGIRAPQYNELPADAQRLLAASKNVLEFEDISGAELYRGLDDVRRAGFLNLMAKSSLTVFNNGQSVLSYLTELLKLDGDRFLVKSDPDLRSETANAVTAETFNEVSGALHHPPPGYDPDGSYKTPDHYGNLQLSFFRNSDGDYTVDMDIDDAQGLEHIFQVVKNTLSGKPTHPYNIHEILLASQNMDAGYELIIREVPV